MTSAAERKAVNEGMFRDANERLQRGATAILGGDDGEVVPFLCECPQLGCTNVALLTLAEYSEIRAEGTRGLAVLGHEDPSVERVVARNDRFVTTEKFGPAGELHEQRDPRG